MPLAALDVTVGQMFDGVSETFDPTSAIEFTAREGDPDHMQRFRVGDVINMRIVINT